MTAQRVKQIINKTVPITWVIAVVFGAIVWGIKLEGKVAANENDIIRNYNSMVTQQEAVLRHLGDIEREIKKVSKNQALLLHDVGIQPVE